MKYIAYGSNMSVEQMAFRCPNAHIVGVGYLEGWQLEFYLHATVEPVVNGRVPVVVWEISPSDEAMLDRYEGVPTYYDKERATAKLIDGEEVRGLIYRMVRFRNYPPSRGYLSGIHEAYLKFGFVKEMESLTKACERSKKRYWRNYNGCDM